MNDEVRRYANAASRERRALFDELERLIKGLYPGVEVAMSYRIPTYRAKSGWVGLGYWKDGVSLYTDGPEHVADFKAKYPKIKTGKGSINLKVTDAVPAAALKKVIRHAMERPASNRSAGG